MQILLADDGAGYRLLEDYISANTEVRFSHGICPNCYKSVVEPQLAQTGIAP
jgi:hypothetical protein